MRQTNQQCEHTDAQSEDSFCVTCGRLRHGVRWTLSLGDIKVSLNDYVIGNAPFYVTLHQQLELTAHNDTSLVIPVRVSLDQATGITLDESGDSKIAPKGVKSFRLTVNSDPLRGELAIESKTGPRSKDTWWDPTEWARLPLPALHQWMASTVEEWEIGVSDAFYFLPGVPSRSVRVWNRSFRPRRLCCRTPLGYSVAIEASPSGAKGEGGEGLQSGLQREACLDVAPNDSVEVHVKREHIGRTGTNSAGVVEIDDKEFPIELLGFSRKAREEAPVHAVVAIDFGTRNTRVRVLWLAAAGGPRPYNRSVPVAPSGEENPDYFPSAMIFDRLTGMVIQVGTQAEQIIDEKRVEPGWVAVTDLKTRLRHNQPPPSEFADDITTERLLERYFEYLLGCVSGYMQSVAAPYLRQRLNIIYAACYPVLDGGPDQESYRELLKTALEKAGIGVGRIELVSEPTAALIHFAYDRPDMIKLLQDGDKVAVVDSGGGTTDITIATFLWTEGRPNPEHLTSDVLELARTDLIDEVYRHFAPVGTQNQQIENQFGGDVLDLVTAYLLANEVRQDDDPNSILRFDGLARPKELDLWSLDRDAVLRKSWMLTRARLVKEGLSLSKTEIVRLDKPEEDPPLPYLPPFHGMSDESQPYKDLYITEPDYRSHIVDPVLGASVARAPKNHADRVICVGGTSISKLARDKFRGLFSAADPEGYDDKLDENVRLNAVVEGAARCFADFIQQLPITLMIDLDDGEGPRALPTNIERVPKTLLFPVDIPARLWNPKLIGDIREQVRLTDSASGSSQGTVPPPPAPLAASISLEDAFKAFTADFEAGPAPSVDESHQIIVPEIQNDQPERDESRVLLAQGYVDGRRMENGEATLWIEMSVACGVRCFVEPTTGNLPRQDLWIFPLFGSNL